MECDDSTLPLLAWHRVKLPRGRKVREMKDSPREKRELSFSLSVEDRGPGVIPPNKLSQTNKLATSSVE